MRVKVASIVLRAYLSIRRGTDESAAPIATAVARIQAADFARQLLTCAGRARAAT